MAYNILIITFGTIIVTREGWGSFVKCAVYKKGDVSMTRTASLPLFLIPVGKGREIGSGQRPKVVHGKECVRVKTRCVVVPLPDSYRNGARDPLDVLSEALDPLEEILLRARA